MRVASIVCHKSANQAVERRTEDKSTSRVFDLDPVLNSVLRKTDGPRLSRDKRGASVSLRVAPRSMLHMPIYAPIASFSILYLDDNTLAGYCESILSRNLPANR